MAFGLRNALVQRLTKTVLGGLRDKIALPHINDIEADTFN